jgi:MFS family permease
MLSAAVLLVIATILAFFIQSAPLAFIFSVLLGCAHAAVLVCTISLFNAYFGTAHFSEILGVSTFLKIVSVLGAPVGGLLFDAQGTYFTALIVMAISAVFGLLCTIAGLSPKNPSLKPRKRPAASAA